MTTPKDVPPQVIQVAEQNYAEVNGMLDKIVKTLTDGLREHPEFRYSASILWYCSAIDYRDELTKVLGDPIVSTIIHHHTADIMIAAAFRLAKQEVYGDDQT